MNGLMRKSFFLIPLLTLFVAVRAHALVADSADDVCAPAANPCNVTSVIDVVNDSELDFGSRTVNVSGGGRFDFGAGNGTILCGSFNATTSGAAINASALVSGTSRGGLVTIEARRACTSGSRACVDGADCQLGSCSTRRCTLRSTRECTGDSQCQLGICQANRRCSLSTTNRCLTNADCDLGTCPAQLTCSDQANEPVNCTTNVDCDYGTCTTGAGSIDMNGAITGNAQEPAIIVLRAADDVKIRKLVNLNSLAVESDGGELEVQAAAGSVEITGKIQLSSGGDGTGGSVNVRAGTDITFTEEIDATGGDFDGGTIDIEGGRDVVIGQDFIANSIAGAGFGGEILVEAGRDLTVNGVSASNKTRFATEGHTDITNFAGDGGTQELTAGRNLSLNTNTRFEGSGSIPDGFGADLFIDVGGNFLMNGYVETKSQGGEGAGGFVEVIADGTATVGTAAGFNVTGGSAGGGVVEFLANGNVDYSGTVDVTAGGGAGGSALIDSGATATVLGTLTTNGSQVGAGDGDLEVAGCRVTLGATGFLDNKAVGGDNTLVARESMKLLAGSKMINTNGANILVFRTAAKQPQQSGTVTPLATLVVDGTLVGCPVCANSELDQTETCDDGNLTNGDGCSSTCQNEKCLAQTAAPGFPTVPLCDDGIGCTVDTCNTTLAGGTCQHVFLCDDGIACTTDTCVGTECVNTPNDGSCTDSNPCTDGVCSTSTGCTQVANNAPCEDGLFCTDGDACSGSSCQPGPARDCGDGVACTVDSCNESTNACGSSPSNALCSDGAFCNGAEICDAEDGCGPGAAVDCSGLDSFCADGVCNEATDSCGVSGLNEGEGCDDGNFCTVGDTCVAGVCTGTARDCSDTFECTVDSCSEATDSCLHAGNDAACSDNVFCNGAETCNVDSGCQSAAAPDCSGLDSACSDGVCDESADSCVAAPINETAGCDDGLFCTEGDVCTGGQCTGSARDCSDLDDTCLAGVCSEATDSCTAQAANQGGGCDDGDVCTSNDQCNAGACQGTPIGGCGFCGDGNVNAGEACDDGNTVFVQGEFCAANCTRVPCARPTNSTGTNPGAADALFVLRTAVGQKTCDLRVCDVDNNTKVQASDALRILRAAVGQVQTLNCPLV